MPAPSRQPPAVSTSQPKTASVPAAPVLTSSQPSVNRKKAKRRAKEAAKRAATGPGDAGPSEASPRAQNGDLHVPGAFDETQGYLPEDADLDDGLETDQEDAIYAQRLHAQSKSKKKRKNRKGLDSIDGLDTFPEHNFSSHPAPPLPPPESIAHSPDLARPTYNKKGDRIWNTSTSEERENIKEFWLELDEDERRSLVKVEKEAVLKKMKEQQKHSCSCSVCGRKRTAIEEELEVLYDAYYDELEQYANTNNVIMEDGAMVSERPPQLKDYYPPHPTGRLPPLNGPNGLQSRFQEEPDYEDDVGDEVYSEDEEGYDDEYDDPPPQSALEFFNFGKSLTVQGGILTVADDLLKNDGKKFIEMMEQLAERRMQREEQAQYAAQGIRHPNSYVPNHQPPLEDEDQYDDEDYATEDDYDDEEDEEEAVGCMIPGDSEPIADDLQDEGLTEEQRMEEGRRMFQIFAARMFEQRVLNAYREKVAKERQNKLLEELQEEENRDADRDAKRARDAAKKKAKKEKLKKEKEEARLKKLEQEQAADAAAKAEEERRAEELRVKREEQKRKKEDEKRRQEEEKQRKEEDRRKKQADARRAQEEAERKQKEAKEKERLKKEETKRKEREDREVKEKDAKERRDREAAEKKDREAKAKAEKQPVKEQTKKFEQPPKGPSQQQTATPVPPILRKQTSNPPSAPVPVQTNLTTQSAAQGSPHLQIATPAIPKAPSPVKPRQASQQGSVQGSHQSSPKSSQRPSGSSATSPSTTQQVAPPNTQQQHPKNHVHVPQTLPHTQNQGHHQVPPPPGMQYPAGTGPPGYASYAPHAPASHPRYPPGFDPNSHMSNHFGTQFRGFPGTNGAPPGIQQQYPPGLSNMRPIGTGPPAISPSSATSPHTPAGAFNHPPAPVGQRIPGHSRQPSQSFERTIDTTAAQPIGPPQHSRRLSDNGAADELNSTQLGSSALLGDDDEPEEPVREPVRHAMPPASLAPGSTSANLFQRPFGSPFPTSSMAFGQSPVLPSWSSGGNTPGWSGTASDPFNPLGRHYSDSPTQLRQLLVQAIRHLNNSHHTQANQRNGYHPIDILTTEVNALLARYGDRVHSDKLYALCDTLGNAQNGGGTLHVTGNDHEGLWVKFEEDRAIAPGAPRGSIGGDIGSPMMAPGQPVPHHGSQFHHGAHQQAPGFGGFGGPGPQRGGFGQQQPMRPNYS